MPVPGVYSWICARMTHLGHSLDVHALVQHSSMPLAASVCCTHWHQSFCHSASLQEALSIPMCEAEAGIQAAVQALALVLKPLAPDPCHWAEGPVLILLEWGDMVLAHECLGFDLPYVLREVRAHILDGGREGGLAGAF